MSRLEELIQVLCPDGVEYRNLGDIGRVAMCKRIMKAETVSDGDIPFYKIGTFGKAPNAYISVETYERYKRNYSFPRKGDVLISAAGTIGRTVIYDGEAAYYQDSNIVWLEHDESQVINKYLYYCYQLSPWCISTGGTIARLYNDNIAKAEIPVPPLPIQQEIVRILDTFTALEAELEAELEKRKAQYEHYRNELLTFGDDTLIISLGEMLQPKGYIRGPFGSALKKEYFVGNGVPVYEQQHAIYGKREFRYFIDDKRADTLKRFLVKPQDLIISCSGTIGRISIIDQKDPEGIINQALLILRLNLSKVLIKYVKYYLEAFPNLIICSTGGAITNIEKREVIEGIKIPLPPLEEQKRIVATLDRFDALVNDIAQGLPAEITARRKQYEYYRDKLLTFKRKEAVV